MFAGFYFILLGILLLLTQPYKVKALNKLDTVFVLFIAMACSFHLPAGSDLGMVFVIASLFSFVASVSILYGCVVIIHKLTPEKIATSVRVFLQHLYRKQSRISQIALPDRFQDVDENSRLLIIPH